MPYYRLYRAYQSGKLKTKKIGKYRYTSAAWLGEMISTPDAAPSVIVKPEREKPKVKNLTYRFLDPKQSGEGKA